MSEQEIILASLASLSAPALYAQENPGVEAEASDLRLQGLAKGHITWGSLNDAEKRNPKFVVAALGQLDPKQQRLILREVDEVIFNSPELLKAIPIIIRDLPISLVAELPLKYLAKQHLPSETLEKMSDCRDKLLSEDIRHPALFDLIKITRDSWSPNEAVRARFLSLAQDFESLPEIPDELSRYPDVQAHVRDILNKELLSYKMSGQLIALPNIFVTAWHRDVPEVLRFLDLSQDAGGRFNIVREIQSNFYHWNCGAVDETLFMLNKNIPSQMLQASGDTRAILEELGIYGARRFDNAAEIILNRFELLSNKEQMALEERFGNNPILLSSIDLAPKSEREAEAKLRLKSRPYALVIAVRPAADHNGVFDVMNERGPSRDYLDRLAVGHKVLYFEVNGSDQFLETLALVAKKLPHQIELFLPMAHGYETEMVWGEFWSDHENLFSGDERLKKLTNLMKPGGKIGLISCSTAGNPQGEQKSVFQQYVEVFSDCFVYGPTMPTLLPMMNLDKQGRFVSLKYVDWEGEVEGLVYDPETKSVHREEGSLPKDELAALAPTEEFKIGFRFGIFFTTASVALMAGLGLIAGRVGSFNNKIRAGIKEVKEDRSLFPSFRKGAIKAFIAGFRGLS